MVLETIIDHKRDEVVARKKRRPVEEILDRLVKSDRSFESALRKSRTGFVLECKKASPSKGVIRHDFDPVAIAREYAAFADAVSVLADERFFRGSTEHVRAVSCAVEIPVLFKDFILDRYQVFEAREAGANAVLLMLSVLDDEQFRSCSAAAESVGMDVLAEVHNEEEMARAVDLKARIIGINNRNLKNLEVDLSTTERLCLCAPQDRVLLAESGIIDRSDIKRLRSNVDAFLVGSSLMKQADISKACKRLIFGTVKICGLTRPSDAVAAATAGASYGGLIFVEKSPRKVSKDQALQIRRSAPLDWVGVFADEPTKNIAGIARDLELKAVQLHGDESAEEIAELKALLPEGCEIWKAIRVGGKMPKMNGMGATRILLDSYSPDKSGGTGKSFDWSMLDGLDISNVILGGGLTPDNADEADNLGAFALDVNSGVELSPGAKSPELINRFFSALRGQGRNGGQR